MQKFMTFVYLLLVAVTLVLVALALANRECVMGQVCADWWRAPATATAEARGTMGADQFYIQLTEIAK